uniref:Uncharacterized protein n=1 Tax=Anguilla anguilla TaxID=7936 RepID=A0A0E9T8C3_ANGAN
MTFLKICTWFGKGKNATPSTRSGYLVSLLQVPHAHLFTIFE